MHWSRLCHGADGHGHAVLTAVRPPHESARVIFMDVQAIGCLPYQGLLASAPQWRPQCRPTAARLKTAAGMGASPGCAAPAEAVQDRYSTWSWPGSTDQVEGRQAHASYIRAWLALKPPRKAKPSLLWQVSMWTIPYDTSNPHSCP